MSACCKFQGCPQRAVVELRWTEPYATTTSVCTAHRGYLRARGWIADRETDLRTRT